MSPNTKLKGGDVHMTRLQTITSLSLFLGLFNLARGLRILALLALFSLSAHAAVISSLQSTTTTATAVIDRDGDAGVSTVISSAWRGTNAQPRFRLSRNAPDANGAQHFLIDPYQYGIAFEYNPGTVEWWVNDFSVHAPDPRGTKTGRFWVGDQLDSGGLFARGWSGRDGSRFAEVASETFADTTHGDLRFRVVEATNRFELRYGTEESSVVAHTFTRTEANVPKLTVGKSGTTLRDDRLLVGGDTLYLGTFGVAKMELSGGNLIPLKPSFDLGHSTLPWGHVWTRNLVLVDPENGIAKLVTVGEPDSGGRGYRALRIEN